jgi:hypothetical protein
MGEGASGFSSDLAVCSITLLDTPTCGGTSSDILLGAAITGDASSVAISNVTQNTEYNSLVRMTLLLFKGENANVESHPTTLQNKAELLYRKSLTVIPETDTRLLYCRRRREFAGVLYSLIYILIYFM